MTSVLLNGEIVSADGAHVSVFDGGWLHGAGLFETMRAEHGRVFRLEAHIERLRRSAERLLRTIERSALPDAGVFSELLRRNNLEAGRIRLTVTPGSMLSEMAETWSPWTVCVTATALSSYPPRTYEHGVRAALCDFRLSPSDPLAGHKTTSYLPRLLALREAQAKQCAEAIWFTTQNRLSEGSISNVFLVRGGGLRTPPLDTPVLPGIARGIVMELARKLGIEVQENPLSGNELLDAEEVFLTNSIVQVLPVVAVERHDIGDGKVGPVARQLLDAYRERVREECQGG